MRRPLLWIALVALAANACQESRPSTGPTRASPADSVRGIYLQHDTTLIDSPIEGPGGGATRRR